MMAPAGTEIPQDELAAVITLARAFLDSQESQSPGFVWFVDRTGVLHKAWVPAVMPRSVVRDPSLPRCWVHGTVRKLTVLQWDLLGILMSDKAVHRDVICHRLWPHRRATIAHMRSNLVQLMANLLQALGDPTLIPACNQGFYTLDPDLVTEMDRPAR